MLLPDHLQNLVPICLAFFIVTVSPGPANIAVATVAMRNGRRKALQYGTGLSLGLGFWGLVAATGMGTVLQSSPSVLLALKLFGGTYLLWLAYNAALAAINGNADSLETGAKRNGLLQGLVLNMSNPKAVFAWMAALSMGMSAESGNGQIAMATAICIGLGLINYTFYALAFSLPGFMAGYHLMSRWVEGAVAGLFSLAALGLLRSALTED